MTSTRGAGAPPKEGSKAGGAAPQTPKLRLPPAQYTVGWICAISPEHVAAQLFLDEVHEGPESVPANDNNSYVLGRCGKHNVVIVVLPDRGYGVASAAGVAKDMLRSFPSIRFGLMVGVGGGAPDRHHDIRLGDVVVSSPGDGNGGVLQYDFGKTIQDQAFHSTGFLNQPPSILRNAVSALRDHYQIHGHQIPQTIDRLLRKNPRLQRRFGRPQPADDRLYRSEYVHVGSSGTDCTERCGVDAKNVILRPPRTEHDDDPTIHYGLIASGNVLMKDAILRDRLAADKGILCFEMEAAGLMNHLPCLVIRGISDYSDSHKSKAWQGYSALTAAAYAKDILDRIPPNKVEAEEKASELLAQMLDPVSKIETNIKTLGLQWDRRERHDILDWLTPVDYGTQQSDYLSRHQAGTGQWLLSHSDFRNWIQTKGATIFCPGMPGAGKTIITSAVIDTLRNLFAKDEDVTLAYVYCDFRRYHEQKAEDLLSSLLKQLSQGRSALPDPMRSLYDEHRRSRTRPSVGDISKTLQSVAAMYSRVFIVIDALDECRQAGGQRAQLLRTVFDLRDKVQVNLFVTSRPIWQIEERFSEDTTIEIRATSEDVQSYLASQMHKVPSFIRRNAGLWEQTKATIAAAVDGMFLLAPLHIDAIATEPTVGHVERALKKLPRRLDETYDQAFERIDSQGEGLRELARKVLTWVTYAKKRLSVAELQHALAVEPGQPALDQNLIPDIDTIGSVCAGLVNFDAQSNVVRLVHYTAQEYLERTRRLPEAENRLLTICLTYLSFDEFSSGPCQTVAAYMNRLQEYPLFSYAGQNWGHHARLVHNCSDVVLPFLECKAHLEASVQTMAKSVSKSDTLPTDITGLHVAAAFGIEEVVEALLDQIVNANAAHTINAKDSFGITPLYRAVMNLRLGTVKMILETGIADADAGDLHQVTPLAWASMHGHADVARLLLDTGKVDVNFRNTEGLTPLGWAVRYGHSPLVKLLLDSGKAEANPKDRYGMTPLFDAVVRGDLEVVKLLLGSDKIQVDPKDSTGLTPLYWTAWSGHGEVFKTLLSKQADLSVADDMGRTLLHEAAKAGSVTIIELLLGLATTQPMKTDKLGRTALFYAARFGRTDAVMALLSDGRTDPNFSDWCSLTPLFAAIANGHLEAVKLLLAGSQTLDKRLYLGRNILLWAQDAGNPRLVDFLYTLSPNQNDLPPPTIEHRLFDDGIPWCDACTLTLVVQDYSFCTECRTFRLCVNCVEEGIRCPFEGHALVPNPRLKPRPKM